MRIAEAFGISTVPSSLIRLKSGELSYISRRIDRLLVDEQLALTLEGKKRKLGRADFIRLAKGLGLND